MGTGGTGVAPVMFNDDGRDARGPWVVAFGAEGRRDAPAATLQAKQPYFGGKIWDQSFFMSTMIQPRCGASARAVTSLPVLLASLS